MVRTLFLVQLLLQAAELVDKPEVLLYSLEVLEEAAVADPQVPVEQELVVKVITVVLVLA